MEKCELCGTQCELTRHHLIPRLKAKNKYKEMKNDPSNILMICRSCHDFVHANFSENELRDMYNTKEALMSNDEIQKFLKWKKKHPDFSGHSKMSHKRKNK